MPSLILNGPSFDKIPTGADTDEKSGQLKQNYIRLEKDLLDYAISKDKPISTLDIAIWVVMRLVQREFIIWQW